VIVAIVGGSGGIGAALVRALVATDDVTRIYAKSNGLNSMPQTNQRFVTGLRTWVRLIG